MFDKLKKIINIFFEKNKKVKITPFESYFPSANLLNKKQYLTYKFIKQSLQKGVFVDVQDNISYIFLYIYDILKSIESTQDVPSAIDKLNRIKKLYESYDKIKNSITYWTADLFYAVKDYESAICLYKSLLSLRNINTHLANDLLNIKYKLNMKTDAIEWLSLNKKFTNFIADRYEDVQPYCDFVLSEERKYLKKDFLQYIMEKYSEAPEYLKYPNYLFAGLVFGYDLQQKLGVENDFYVPLYLIPEVLKFGEKLSRDAENLLREKLEMPKIGEGWISETELFYKIKSSYPNYTVVHHYREKWLGKQHLDVYIKELRIAFEYQGLQHFKPVDFFGGEKAFLENIRRDKLKKEKCKKENVILYEVEPGYNFDDIVSTIDNHIKSISKKEV